MDQRAADFLLRLLIQSSSSPTARFEEAEGALAAYEALGLADAADVGEWQRRFSDEQTGREVETLRPDDALAERARRLLDSRVEDHLAAGPREDAVQAAIRLVQAFGQVGLIGTAEVGERVDSLYDSLRGEEPGDEPEPSPHPTAARLVRFVPGPLDRHAGVRVIGFDLYEDGVAVRSQLVRLARDVDGSLRRLPDEVESDKAAQDASELWFTLHDDVGTEYEPQGGGGGSHSSPFVDRVVKHISWFAGAVPADARALWAVSGPYRFEVTL